MGYLKSSVILVLGAVLVILFVQESHQQSDKDDQIAFLQYSLKALLKVNKDGPVELKDVKLEKCARGVECDNGNDVPQETDDAPILNKSDLDASDTEYDDYYYKSDSTNSVHDGSDYDSKYSDYSSMSYYDSEPRSTKSQRNKENNKSVAEKSYVMGEHLFAFQTNGKGNNSGVTTYEKSKYFLATDDYEKGKNSNTSKYSNHNESSVDSDSNKSDSYSHYNISDSKESHDREIHLQESGKTKGSKQKEHMVHSDSESSEKSDTSSSKKSDSASSDHSESHSSDSDSSSSEESDSSESDSSDSDSSKSDSSKSDSSKSDSSKSDSSESDSSKSHSSESDSSKSDSDSSSSKISDSSESNLHRPKSNKPSKSKYISISKPKNDVGKNSNRTNAKHPDSRENESDYSIFYDDAVNKSELNPQSHSIVIHINPHN